MEKVLEIIISNDLYGVGEYTEIAKGKYQMITTFKEAKQKIKRRWLLKSK